MILIVSSEMDHSTSQVVEWLHYLGGDVIRLNGEEILTYESCFYLELNNESEVSACTNRMGYSEVFNAVNSVWFRRNGTCSDFIDVLRAAYRSKLNDHQRDTLIRALQDEYVAINGAHLQLIQNHKRTLGIPNPDKVDKIDTLVKAKEAGLFIPASLITGSLDQLKGFMNKVGTVITKAAKEGLSINDNEQRFCNQYTEELSAAIVDTLPEQFFPSFFQEKLDKEIEIRSFYLDGVFYSMAIFSQLDDQTDVDFRKYNYSKPNNMVPFKLPQVIEQQLTSFMNTMGLNTGSIDMVVTKNDRFVFLEVNPVGQFEMVSYPCNYYLEKKIAEYLMIN